MNKYKFLIKNNHKYNNGYIIHVGLIFSFSEYFHTADDAINFINAQDDKNDFFWENLHIDFYKLENINN